MSPSFHSSQQEEKVPWSVIALGMDYLFFTPFLKEELIDDRAQAVEDFLQANGWTWDMVLDMIAKESYDEQSLN